MDIFIIRIFLFAVLPLLFAAGQIWLDKSTNNRDRRLEVVLIYLFALSVAGSGIGGFFAHFFMADLIAASIGWPPGSPFQLEIAFANLAIGILGIMSVSRRDGTREATVVAATTFAVGATIVHLLDIAATGNLAPGNSLQNVVNLLRPALLITFLVLSRRAEQAPGTEVGKPSFDLWRGRGGWRLETLRPLLPLVLGWDLPLDGRSWAAPWAFWPAWLSFTSPFPALLPLRL